MVLRCPNRAKKTNERFPACSDSRRSGGRRVRVIEICWQKREFFDVR
jgi:hypothetical protein